MDHIIHAYVVSSVAPSTFSCYRSALNRYLDFCHRFQLSSFPLNPLNVTRFVVYLAQTGVTYPSIRSYLSGIRFMQIVQGLPDPCLSSDATLRCVLRGIHRLPVVTQRPPRLPVTPEILQQLHDSWSSWPVEHRYDASMLWAAVCLGFFGFMRAGEFTCPSLQAFNSRRLGVQDVSVDSHQAPRVVSVHLRHSKNDPFGNGVTIYLGRTQRPICPVAALLGYLARRGNSPGPLFLFRDGSTLSRQRLVRRMQQALAPYGVDYSHLTGHSFRIGAASAASRAGIEDSMIQTLGRWRSSAYLRYIRIPGQMLAATSERLLNCGDHLNPAGE